MRRYAFVLVGLCLLTAGSWGGESPSDFSKNWPQWRGPEGTGIAPYGDPPVEWAEDKNVRWKIEIPGEGHASPIVWGEKIFILTAIETEKAGESKKEAEDEDPSSRGRRRMGIKKPTKIHEFVLLAIDRKSGKVLWRKTVCEELPHEGKHRDGSWASNSPVTDGERVYAHYGSRGLYCFDMEGKPLWKRNLGKMKIKMSFGEGSSPVLHGDKLIINWDHEGQSFITALDKKTGKDLWKVDRDEDTTWATPLVVEYEGKPQVITNGTTRVRSYDLATGKLIWECGGMTRNAIPSPVSQDGMVIVMTGFRGSSLLAIRLAEASEDITGSEAIAWKHDKDTPYVPSTLLYGDTLFFLQANNGILSCFNTRTGEANYTRQKLEGVKGIYASPVGAKDRVYLTGRNGVVLAIKRGPKYEVLATNVLDDSFSASPAIVDKEMVLRGHKYLYCIARD